MTKIFQWIWNFLVVLIGKVRWDKLRGWFHHGKYWNLTENDWTLISEKLSKNYYVILTRRKTHLSTYLIELAYFLKTGKLGYWSHVFMNLEGDSPKKSEDYRFVEATGVGTHYSKFNEVFDCDSVCLLVPKGFTPENWTEALDKLLSNVGKPYDTLFDLKNDQALSCVELVYDSLEASDSATTTFRNLDEMIKRTKYLFPQTFYDCDDFVKVLEIRK